MSDNLRDASRALANWAVTVGDSVADLSFSFGEAFCTWYTVLVDELRDMRAPFDNSDNVRGYWWRSKAYLV